MEYKPNDVFVGVIDFFGILFFKPWFPARFFCSCTAISSSASWD